MKAKKIFMSLLACVAMLALCVGSFSVGAATVADATIDTTKTGSLSIYKYDITSAKADGVWDETSYESTGVKDETGVNAVLGNPDKPKTLPNGDTSYGYAIKGVEFTYLKIADITTITAAGTVQVLYGFDNSGNAETMLEAIGLSWDDREQAADTATTYYFSAETLIDAFSTSLTANATTVKNALEAYVTANGGTAMTETDEYGYTADDELPLGLYLIVETAAPEYVTTPTAPFLVTLPMTSINGTNATDGGERWIYDVTVYPKNETGEPTLEKTVREDKEDTGKNDGTTDDITDGYAHTATGSDGDVMEYQIISTLPTITSTASYLTTYTYVDTLSKGITYNKDDVVIEWFADAACTELVATWAQTDATAKFAVAYAAGTNDAEVMTITMTEAGLAEINTADTVYTTADAVDSGYSACTMRITYAATVNSDATVVYGDGGNPNEVELTWERTSANYFDTLRDCCHVYTYGIDLTKFFSDNKGDFSKVTFALYNNTDSYFLMADLIDGVYYVTGRVADEADATKFVPNDAGKVIVKGMEDDKYALTELKTDNGYALNKDAVNFEIIATESTTECDVCHKMLLTASATCDGETIDMLEDNASVNALAKLEILNRRQIIPPVTGEAGVWALTCGGTALASLSMMFILVLARRKKGEAAN